MKKSDETEAPGGKALTPWGYPTIFAARNHLGTVSKGLDVFVRQPDAAAVFSQHAAKTQARFGVGMSIPRQAAKCTSGTHRRVGCTSSQEAGQSSLPGAAVERVGCLLKLHAVQKSSHIIEIVSAIVVRIDENVGA